MPNKADILERRNFFGDRISSQVRLISIGLLVTTWGLLIGTIPLTKSNEIKTALIIVAALSILSLFFDFLQYLFGFLNINRLLIEMERTNSETGNFKYDCFYKLSSFLFWAKQFLLAFGVFLFVYCVFGLAFLMNTKC